MLLLAGCGPRQDRTALQEGFRTLKSGHYSQSVILFQRAVRDNVSQEDNALAFNGLGIAYARLQQKDNAARMFEKASRIDPGRVEPVYNLGVLKYEVGREAEAVICFEKAALIDPRETRPLEFLADIYRKRQQPDEARRVLAEARARDPISPRVLTSLAVLELQTNNAEAALALLQQALEHDARYAPAVFNMAVIDRRRAPSPGQARIHFKEYLELVPEGPQADQARRALKELPEGAPASPGAVTSAAAGPGPQPAPAPAPAAEVKAPQPAPVVPLSAEEWMGVAKKLERAGRREAAVNSYVKAAREAGRAGNEPLRKKALEQAGEQCADDARATYELGRYYADNKQNEQAVVWLKKAVGLSTNWFEAQFALARTALEVDELDTARLLVKQAEQGRPGQAGELWSLAQFCDRNAGLQDLASPLYGSFVKQHPEDARAGAARERIAELAAGAPRTSGAAPEPASESQGGANTNSSWWGWLTR